MNWLLTQVDSAMQNKHTSIAALVYFALGVIGIWFPDLKPKLDEVAKLAMFYGLFKAADAPKSRGGSNGVADKSQLKLLFFILVLWLGSMCSGCSTAGMARITKELAKDPATVVLKVSTIYGTVNLTRVGCVTNGMVVAPDGTVSVK